MRLATDLKAGMAIRLDREICRVTEAAWHAGSGQMKGFMHATLRNVRTGSSTERRFRQEERFEEVELDRREMEYLPGKRLQVEFLGEEPLGAVHPRTVDLRIRMTAEATHGSQETNVFKGAVLENGVEILVPQWVRQGDLVRVDVESGKYVDRVR